MAVAIWFPMAASSRSLSSEFRWPPSPARSIITPNCLFPARKGTRAKAFFREGDFGRDEARDLLKEYQRQTDRVQYEFIDWEARPGDAISYELQSFRVIVLEAGSRRQDVSGFTEQDLTSAIFKVSQGAPKKIYFSTGHGEPDIASAAETGVGIAREALEASNYQVQAVTLATTEAIGGDVAALIVNAPQTPLHEQEKKIVKEYLDRGGKVMLLIAPKRTADLSDILAPYGLELGAGIAIDAGDRVACRGSFGRADKPVAIVERDRGQGRTIGGRIFSAGIAGAIGAVPGVVGHRDRGRDRAIRQSGQIGAKAAIAEARNHYVVQHVAVGEGHRGCRIAVDVGNGVAGCRGFRRADEAVAIVEDDRGHGRGIRNRIEARGIAGSIRRVGGSIGDDDRS